MKTPNKIHLTAVAFIGLLQLAASTAFGFYNPQTGRWLSRDPVGEPGFQVLQAANAVPQPGSPPALPPGRFMNRDPLSRSALEFRVNGIAMDTSDGPNLYGFVLNNPLNNVDAVGLLTFEGCSADQQAKLQSDFTSFCNQVKSSAFKCCLNHFNIPQRLAHMCDNNSEIKIKCEPSNTGNCSDSCGWSLPGGNTIHMCPLGLVPDPGCGPFGCTLLHEMTHMVGHPFEKWPNKVENCLQGCPKRK